MGVLLEKLCRASYPDIEPNDDFERIFWYVAPDNITQIKSKDFNQTHPIIVIDESTLKYGFIKSWIRTSTGRGSIPLWLPHIAHEQSHQRRCTLNKDGFVDLQRFRKIPGTHFLRISKSCEELDQEWIRSFSICLKAISLEVDGGS
jgi:hypothetical protein